MPTTFVKGDLFADGHALAFAADCSGEMDKGIAVAFAKRWPALAVAYRGRAAGGKMQLGDVFPWKDESGVVVYALGLQKGLGKPKVSTLTRALDGMIAQALESGVKRIALPRIGAGRGGIDRVRVKRVLEEAGKNVPVELVVYEQFIRDAGAKPAADSPSPEASDG